MCLWAMLALLAAISDYLLTARVMTMRNASTQHLVGGLSSLQLHSWHNNTVTAAVLAAHMEQIRDLHLVALLH